MKVASRGSASTLQVTFVISPRAAPTTTGAIAQRGESVKKKNIKDGGGMVI